MQNREQSRGGLLLLSHGLVRNAFAETVAQIGEQPFVSGFHQRAHRLPLAIGLSQQLLGIIDGRQKPVHGGAVRVGPVLVEHETDQGHPRREPKCGGALRNRDRLAQPLGLQLRRKVPERQHRIEFALLQLGAQQRRRAVDNFGIGGEIDVLGRAPSGLDDQPGFVDRSAGHAEIAAAQVGKTVDGCGLPGHDAARRSRERREGQVGPIGALRRREQPIGHHDITGACHNRHPAGIRVGQRDGAQVESVLRIKAVAVNDVSHPLNGAELQNPETQFRERFGGPCGPQRQIPCRCREHHPPRGLRRRCSVVPCHVCSSWIATVGAMG